MGVKIPYLKLGVSIDVGVGVGSDYSFHSNFRGIFGRALRQTFCIQNRLDCVDCPIRGCLYRKLFEDAGHGHESYRPYIIRHADTRDQRVEMELVIFGQLAEYGSSIMHLLTRLEGRQLRLQGENHPVSLAGVQDLDGRTLYRMGVQEIREPEIHTLSYSPRRRNEIGLRFITPLRLKHEGRLMSGFMLQPVLRSVYQRVEYICRYFLQESDPLPPFAPEYGEVAASTHWQEMYRKSWRQQQKMSLGGLMGEVRIAAPSAQTVGLLKIGELIQAGKQTTFGLGKYEIL